VALLVVGSLVLLWLLLNDLNMNFYKRSGAAVPASDVRGLSLVRVVIGFTAFGGLLHALAHRGAHPGTPEGVQKKSHARQRPSKKSRPKTDGLFKVV